MIIPIIAAREISTRVMSKTWLTVVSLLTVLAVAGSVCGSLLLNQPATITSYAVTPAAVALGDALQASKTDTKIVPVDDEQAGKDLVRNDEANVLIDMTSDASTGKLNVELTVKSALNGVDGAAKALLQTYAAQISLAAEIQSLDGDPAIVSQASFNVSVEENALEESVLTKNMNLYYVGMVVAFIMFLMIMIGGSAIAMGIAEEKGSRIVEILFSTVKPRQLMTGKIVGIGVVNLMQFLIPIAALIISAQALDLLDKVVKMIPELPLGSTITILVAWLLVGYITYTVILAALASTASNTEDARTAITPITIFMMFAFYVAVYVPLFLPTDSIWLHIAVYCPLVAPFVAPTAYAMGLILMPEVLGSLAVSTFLTPIFILISSRIYSRSVLLTGTSFWSRFSRQK